MKAIQVQDLILGQTVLQRIQDKQIKVQTFQKITRLKNDRVEQKHVSQIRIPSILNSMQDCNKRSKRMLKVDFCGAYAFWAIIAHNEFVTVVF